MNDTEKMELLTESITQNRKIFIRLEKRQKRINKEITMTTCVPLYGAGPHSLVMMYGSKSNVSALQSNEKRSIVSIINKTLEEGFKRIDPFKSNLEYFSFYADLKKIDDYKINLAKEGASSLTGEEFDLPRISSCTSKEKYFLHTGKNVAGGGAYTLPLSQWVILTNVQTPAVYLHEYGHAFCGLTDEYIRYFSVDSKKASPTANCVRNANTSFSANGIQYGAVAEAGCTFPDLYRPSSTSLMREPPIEKLNVISCGYCLAQIKGGEAQDHWQTCVNLDTIKLPS